MQEINEKNGKKNKKAEKLLIQKAAGNVLKDLKGNKSNYLFGAEYEISTSLLSHIERGMKDPQLTTIFKLSEALGIKPHEFIRRIEEKLPKNFSLIEE